MPRSSTRTRNSLREDTYRDNRYSEEQPESCLLGGIKAKRHLSVEQTENLKADLTHKGIASWRASENVCEDDDSNVISDDDSNVISDITPLKKLKTGQSGERKAAIKYIFEHVLESPEKNEWKNKEVVSKIMRALEMPVGSRSAVIKVLDAALQSLPNALSKRGRKKSITDYTDEIGDNMDT